MLAQVARLTFLCLNNIPVCVCVCVQCFLYPFTCQQTHCFHSLAIVNNAMNVGMQMSLPDTGFSPFVYTSRSGTARSQDSSIFYFLRHLHIFFIVLFFICFPQGLNQVTFPPTVQKSPLVFTASSTLAVSCLFDNSHSNSTRGYLTVVLICVSLMIKDAEQCLFVYLLATCMSSLGKCLFRNGRKYLQTIHLVRGQYPKYIRNSSISIEKDKQFDLKMGKGTVFGYF